ncbi:MAG: ATP synthase subunit I [Hydrogenothermaceae bacterium]|nr:ATP synthase subunit I [Hydrogenothermaceae bacterium]
MANLIIYIPLFILGFISGVIYFWHMWKSIGVYGTEKSKVLMSMIVRLPFPIGAALIGYVLGKFEGIIAVLIGFTTFQIIFLVKKGQALKKELEEELKRQEREVEKKD